MHSEVTFPPSLFIFNILFTGIGAGLEVMTVDNIERIQKVNPRVC